MLMIGTHHWIIYLMFLNKSCVTKAPPFQRNRINLFKTGIKECCSNVDFGITFCLTKQIFLELIFSARTGINLALISECFKNVLRLVLFTTVSIAIHTKLEKSQTKPSRNGWRWNSHARWTIKVQFWFQETFKYFKQSISDESEWIWQQISAKGTLRANSFSQNASRAKVKERERENKLHKFTFAARF